MALNKILIAEDEILVAKVLKLVLEKNNYEVRHVLDAPTAVIEAMSYKPDAIILDVYLKNNTCGVDAGIEIRENGMLCPIIFTTGNSYEQTMKDTIGIENSHLFIKPIELEQLIYFLQNTLNIKGHA